jgi:hypothetical protein
MKNNVYQNVATTKDVAEKFEAKFDKWAKINSMTNEPYEKIMYIKAKCSKNQRHTN